MTLEEVRAECERLRREHAERDGLTLMVVKVASGEWAVKRVHLPGVSAAPVERCPEALAHSGVRPDPSEAQGPSIWSQLVLLTQATLTASPWVAGWRRAQSVPPMLVS